jgi:anthranilate phosphoribosyltransferase
VLRELGSEQAWVVHADDGLDELSTLGPTRVSELRNGEVHTWSLDPTKFGVQYARLSDLQVSGVEESADVISRVLIGEQGPARDITVLNAGAALLVAGQVDDLRDGLQRAEDAIDTGEANRTLEKLVRCSNA